MGELCDISVVEIDKPRYNRIDLPGKVSLISTLVRLREIRLAEGQFSALSLVCNPCTGHLLTHGHVDPYP